MSSYFEHAQSLLQANEASAAEKILKPYVGMQKNNAEVQELFGLSLFMQGKVKEAKFYLNLAVELQPQKAQFQCNLGECLRKLGEIESAEMHLRIAISLQSGYREAQYNLACTLLMAGNHKEAAELLRNLLKEQPVNKKYLCAYADVLREVGRISSAVEHYKKALQQDSDFVHAHSNLGPLLLAIGQIDGALEHCRRAVELAPKNGISYLNLGRCLVDLEQLDEAMDAYADAFELAPGNVLLLSCIGDAWLQVNDLPQSEYWFMQALEQDESSVKARCGLADVHRESGFVDEAILALDKVIDDNPQNSTVYASRAIALLDSGDVDGCVKDYQRMIELRPQQAGIHASLGHALENAGDLVGAEREFRIALEKNAACIPALKGLATTKNSQLTNNDVNKMLGLIEHKELRDGALASLHCGLSYFYDKTKEYGLAADHINLGNKHYWLSKSRKGWSYDPDDFKKRVDKIISVFNKDYFEGLRMDYGSSSQLPAFILGMPRSGTTLTEQILNSHPKIMGIGEQSFAGESLSSLPVLVGREKGQSLSIVSHLKSKHMDIITSKYLVKLNKLLDRSGRNGIERVVDKMPDNYQNLGWLLTMFPQAKIIHARRDVRDIAVSCWMTQFGKIRWAFNIEHLAERIVQYDRLMKHWRSVVSQRFLETDYESMVLDQEKNSRRLIEFMGFDWNESCLDFYKQDVLVRTASVSQVRQPIYKKSVQRWKRYEKPLEHLLKRIEDAGVTITKEL